jgi:multiple sugar transport system substrate-binding protein
VPTTTHKHGAAVGTRHALPLLLAAALLLAPAGCGKRDTRTVVRFSFWGLKDDVALWSKLAQEFEARHPGIHIKLEHVADLSYQDKIMTMLVGRVAPDIILFDDEPFPHFAQYGVFEDLGPYMARDPGLRHPDIWPLFLKSFQYRGRQLCLPWDGHTVLVYYNRDLFRAAGVREPWRGWTWDDFVDTARKLTLDRDGDGRLDQFGCTYLNWLNGMAFIWEAGGEVYNRDMTRCTVDRPQAITGIRFNQDLVVKYRVAPRSIDLPGMAAEDMFYTGHVAMMVGATYAKPLLRITRGLNWEVAHMPAGPAGVATRLTCDGIGLWKESRHKQEGWEFIRFLLSDYGQRRVALLDRGLPAVRHIAWGKEFTRPDTPQHEERFLEAMDYARLQPLNEQWDESKVVWDREWDLLMLQGKPANRVARDIARQINAILDNARREQMQAARSAAR